MKSILASAGAFLVVSAACSRAAAQFPVDLSGFRWRDDIDLARKAALDEGKPLLVVFR